MTLVQAYRELETPAGASEADLQKNYRDLVRVWHPDNFSTKPDLLELATAKTKRLNEAWEVYLNTGPLRTHPRETADRRARWGPRVAIVALGLVAALALFGLLTAFDVGQPELALAKNLAKISYQANRSLPAPIDDDTVFTATFAGPGRRFTSIYTLRNVTKEQVGPAYFDQIRPALIAHVRAQRGQNEAMKTFEAQGITLGFAFRDKDGADIITLEVPARDYLAP